MPMITDAPKVEPAAVSTYVYDDDVDLRQYLYLLWRRRILVLVFTIVAAFVGLGSAWLTPPTYEASVTLARISTLRIGEEGAAGTALSFRALLQNRRLAERVIRQFSLDAEPYRYTPVSFVNNAVQVEDVDQGAMILAKVTLTHSAALAADVANRLAEGAVELNREMNQAEAAAARDFIKEQLDEARAALTEIEGHLVERQQQAQLGALEADVEAMLASRRHLLTISVEIEGEKAQLAKAVEELSRRDRLLSVPRDVDASAALLDATRQAQAADAAAKELRRTEPTTGREEQTSQPRERSAASAPLNLRSEFINPVYEALDYQVAMSRTRLASLQEQERRLRAVVHAGSARNPTLSSLYTRQIELQRLATEHGLASQNYSDLSRKYEQARIQVASRTSQLEIIDPAMPPERPIAPRPLRTTAIAALIGLFSGVVVVLLLGYLAPGTPTARALGSAPRASSIGPR
jgi:polysaccharide biosynthesis transport protein